MSGLGPGALLYLINSPVSIHSCTCKILTKLLVLALDLALGRLALIQYQIEAQIDKQ